MLLASDGERPGLSILQCAGRPPHGKVAWGPNVGSAKTEQLWARFQAFPERTSDHPPVPPVLMRMDEAAVRSLPYFSAFVLAPPVHFSPKLRAHRRSGRGLRSSLALLRDLGRENRRLWNPADGKWQRESTWHVTRRRHFCSRFIGQCKSHGHAQAHRGWRKET